MESFRPMDTDTDSYDSYDGSSNYEETSSDGDEEDAVVPGEDESSSGEDEEMADADGVVP